MLSNCFVFFLLSCFFYVFSFFCWKSRSLASRRRLSTPPGDCFPNESSGVLRGVVPEVVHRGASGTGSPTSSFGGPRRLRAGRGVSARPVPSRGGSWGRKGILCRGGARALAGQTKQGTKNKKQLQCGGPAPQGASSFVRHTSCRVYAAL